MIPLGIYDDLFSDGPKKAKKELAKLLEDPLLADKTILITLGRLVKRKGVDWFIDNVLSRLSSDEEFVYLVAGEGVEREAILQSIRRHDLEDEVRLLGYVDDRCRRALYNAADIFVMPNIPVPGDLEGFGRVLLEAATCETVVVASNIEGIKDAIIDGKNGILLESKNTETYLEALRGIMSNPKKREKDARESRLYTLKQYGWDRVSSLYLEQYNQLVVQESAHEKT